jgi:lipopolysaccharide export system protein LptA
MAIRTGSYRPRLASIAVVLMLTLQVLCGQSKSPILLDYADEFLGKRVNNEDLQELNGHVRLRQGNVRVWCDRAVRFLARDEVELMGNVKVVRDTVTLTARHGRWYGNEKKAVCDGAVQLTTPHVVLTADLGDYYTEEDKAIFRRHVVVKDASTTIRCDEMTYYERRRESIAVHSVIVENPSNNLILYGNHLIHSDSLHYSKMTERPFVVQIDTAATGEIDTLEVRSMLMESYDDSTGRLFATDSVAIVKGKLAARCALAKYYRTRGIMDLNTEPVVWYDDNQLTGDSVSLRLENKKLSKAYVRGRAFAVSPSDSLYPRRLNQLSGQRMVFSFADSKLRCVDVEQNSISLYFLYDGKDPNGANKTSGDFIAMTFTDGKPEVIRVRKGVEGSYYPENMVAPDQGKYNLDGFRLRTNRPQRALNGIWKPKT